MTAIKPPTFEEAEPGLRMMIGDMPASISLAELRRRSRLAHLWLQFHEVDISRLAYSERLKKAKR